MSVSEAPCVPVDPWPDGKQAGLTLAQENVGDWGQAAASFPPLPQGAQRTTRVSHAMFLTQQTSVLKGHLGTA